MTEKSRRDFLARAAKTLLGVTIVGSVSAVAEACGSSSPTGPTSFKVDVSSLTADGQAVLAQDSGPYGYPILVVRQSGSTYLALSLRCTHLACVVNPPAPGGTIMICPCHGSEYNLSGQVIRGPAQLPLQRFPNSYNSATKTVTVNVG